MALRYFIKIDLLASTTEGNKYHGEVFKESQSLYMLPDLKLSDNFSIKINNENFTISQIVNALTIFKQDDLKTIFSVTGQTKIGEYLYNQIFNQLSPEQEQSLFNDELEIEIRIVTKDDNITKLPWILLFHERKFLIHHKCSIVISETLESKDATLPHIPTILVIAPQPKTINPTLREPHLVELRNLFISYNQQYKSDHKFIVGKTWEDFQMGLRNSPKLLYYYGHGLLNQGSIELAFEKTDESISKISVVDLATEISKLGTSGPVIAYFNCCLGDAGGSLGIGMQVSQYVPVVVTNRTMTFSGPSKINAKNFWRYVINGLSPCSAFNEMLMLENNPYNITNDIDWFTPVLHCNYDEWNTPITPLELTPDDRFFRLDREMQVDTSCALIEDIIQNQKQDPQKSSYQSIVCLWHGEENQGVKDFHKRLENELNRRLKEKYLIDVLPLSLTWPPADLNSILHKSGIKESQKLFKHFRTMLEAIFNVPWNNINNEIRAKVGRGEREKPILTIFNLDTSINNFNTTSDILEEYVKWWDKTFVNEVIKNDENLFAFLAISITMPNDEKLNSILAKLNRLEDDLVLMKTMLRDLKKLEFVKKPDILLCIQRHKEYYPISDLEQRELAREIFFKTNGDYNKTLDLLIKCTKKSFRDEFL